MLALFYPFMTLVDNVMPGAIKMDNVTQAEIDEYKSNQVASDQLVEFDEGKVRKAIVDTNIPLHLALFHTIFNLTNIALLIGFTPQLGKLAERLVKPEADSEGQPPPRKFGGASLRRFGDSPKNRGTQFGFG